MDAVDKGLLERRLASMLRFPSDASNRANGNNDAVRRLYESLTARNARIFMEGLGEEAMRRLGDATMGMETETIARHLWGKAVKSHYVKKEKP